MKDFIIRVSLLIGNIVALLIVCKLPISTNIKVIISMVVGMYLERLFIDLRELKGEKDG